MDASYEAENPIPQEPSKMEVQDDGPEEVILDSQSDDDGSSIEDSEQDEVRSTRPPPTITRNRMDTSTRSEQKPRLQLNRQPDIIDLTKDDNDDDDDDCYEIRDPEPMHVIDDDNDMPELIEVEPVPAKDIAEDRKRKGNDHFKVGEYYQALEMYTKAIEAMPSEASYYGNRSACYMMLKRHKEALADIRTSLQLDPSYEKGYLRLVRTTLVLGQVKECELAFDTVKKLGILVDARTESERLQWFKKQLMDIEATKAKKDFRKLIFLVSQALDVATADNDLKMMKADALVRLGRHTEAQELCTEVLQNDRRCADALYIRAMCLFLDDNIDKSVQFVRQGLQYAPDNNAYQVLLKKLKVVKELRESASTKFSAGRFNEAKQDYVQCLNAVKDGEFRNITIESKLYFNMALIAHKLNQLDDSLEACGKAIELNSNYLKAIIHRARIYVNKEMFDDAVHDYEAALRIDPNLRDLKRELQNTKVAAKRAKRKDYYKILNVDKNATEDEIRKAYKKRALLHHPDRHASATEAVQKDQERLFKDLREAYEVLSDSKKRFRYDQGVDLMEDRGGYEPSYDSSADLFNVFFANGGIPSFRPGQTAGNRGHHHQFHSSFRH